MFLPWRRSNVLLLPKAAGSSMSTFAVSLSRFALDPNAPNFVTAYKKKIQILDDIYQSYNTNLIPSQCYRRYKPILEDLNFKLCAVKVAFC